MSHSLEAAGRRAGAPGAGRRWSNPWTLLAAAGAVALCGCGGSPRGGAAGAARPPPARAERILSLAPSITEVLVALGREDRLVGATRFCLLPASATNVARVGGYYDPNFEAIASLAPDLALILPEHDQARTGLDALGIPYVDVRQQSVEDILESVDVIGRLAGAEERARALRSELEARRRRVRERLAGRPRPRVLLSVGRHVAAGALGEVYVAGRGTFLDELLACAGGENAYGGALAYPTLSAEGLLRMDPDAIIDFVPDLAARGWDAERVRADWRRLDVRAVREGRIHVLGEEYVALPGPRFVETLESMARALHPEAFP